MKIIKAEKSDLLSILSLQKLAYQSEAALYNDYSIQPLTQTLEELEQEFHNSVVLKAVSDGEIIGSVRGYKKDNTAHIGRLIVKPECQNQGVGKALIIALESEFACNRYELFTGHKSVKNFALYEKLGYRRFKEVDVGIFTMVFMEKIR